MDQAKSLKKRAFKYQRRESGSTEHCCVPQCANSARYNSHLSFHAFPSNSEERAKWLAKICRDAFTVTKTKKVCIQHFEPSDFVVPATAGGLRRLKKGVVPTLFAWNDYTRPAPRLGVWERRERPAVSPPPAQSSDNEVDVSCGLLEHDYCKAPEPAALDNALAKIESMGAEIENLRKELETVQLHSKFSVRRFACSDEDIRFYTRFATYEHFVYFWRFIEPCLSKMARVTHWASSSDQDELIPLRAGKLEPVDGLFLFLMYLSTGFTLKHLGQLFNIHRTTASRIVITWANFLYNLLGSLRLWMTPEAVKAQLPREFDKYPDTQVVIDCTEIRCQTPSSLLLQSEVFSTYKSHCTFKGMLGMAPHGAITFVSALYAGSVSDKEIFKQSGIIPLLTPDMAIMVDKGFIVDDLVPCRVYQPAFLSKRTQMLEEDVRETQSIARLRVHVKRCIRRVKENKLFDTVVPLTITGSINQLFSVACFLVNYQNGPLVKAWATE